VDNNQRALSHFGVPGMRWGHRRTASLDRRISKTTAKVQKLESKGKMERAKALKGNIDIYKERKSNVKEIAKIGENIKRGSSFIDKLMGVDVDRMNSKLSKGKYTSSEVFVADLVNGSNNYTMASLVSQRTVYGMK